MDDKSLGSGPGKQSQLPGYDELKVDRGVVHEQMAETKKSERAVALEEVCGCSTGLILRSTCERAGWLKPGRKNETR